MLVLILQLKDIVSLLDLKKKEERKKEKRPSNLLPDRNLFYQPATWIESKRIKNYITSK
jgi:hypothetical protein